MEETIKAIQSTPVPILLILVGLFILILAFVTKIGGVIEVSPEQRRWAIPIGLFVLAIGLVLNFTSPSSTPGPSSVATSSSPGVILAPYKNSAKPFLLQLGSDTDPVSARDEVNRVKEFATKKKLSVNLLKKENLYVTIIGFFGSKGEAESLRNLVVNEIPFFKSTNPLIQDIREWCPKPSQSGTYIEC
jgi:hypothetical protein